MRRSFKEIRLDVLVIAWCAVLAFAQTAPQNAPTSTASASLPDAGASDALERLIDQLGDDDYRMREAATTRILSSGAPALSALQARLETERDPEIRFRLRFIIDNLQPPDAAALVVRSAPTSPLQPGDLITHVNNRRIRGRTELAQHVRNAPVPVQLRLRGPAGPRDVGPIDWEDPPILCDYRAPRGQTIAAALRLYATGYAERADELLRTLDAPSPESELAPLLRAIIAYTAGDAAAAQRLVAAHPDAAQPVFPYSAWTSPSALDLAGPGQAPFHLEWELWTQQSAPPPESNADPDLAIQRVLVPAGRYADALQRVATLWWTQYRQRLGTQPDTDRVAGNLLAVTAWMLSELDLRSECLRLIEPRSEILRSSPQAVRKWLRVQTDAWLPFLQGQPAQALDALFEDARTILQPPGPPPTRALIQNPRVAATVAFFLYQFPNDPRVLDLLSLVNQPGQPALADYAYWMVAAVRDENFDAVYEHLQKMLSNAPDPEGPSFARALALLEMVRPRPEHAVFEAARERLGDAPEDPRRAAWKALIDAIEQLAGGQAAAALELLDAAGDLPGVAVLRTTADFVASPPPGAKDDPALQTPLLATPVGLDGQTWLLLTRARQLVRYRADTGELTPVEKPSTTWFPGPLNWPWLGREPRSGRVWVYDRRRVVEVSQTTGPAWALNVGLNDSAMFDRYARAVFSTLVNAGTAPTESMTSVPSSDEPAEFWREDLRAGGEYFADPALPELGFLRVLPDDPRVVHIALRGGPHWLVDASSGKVWTSRWVQEQLGLSSPPHFIAQAAREQPTPVLFLLSDHGLIRFDVAAEKLTRLALPGDAPHAAVIPEWCPYTRRDPRWLYCARLPADGGRVFRVDVASDTIEALDLVNESLPREYFLMQTRAALRRQLDAAFARQGLPPLREFIADATRVVAEYAKEPPP